jgi:hypothetical protein
MKGEQMNNEQMKRQQIEEYGRIFDYGTISILSQALGEVLDLFLDARMLDRLDDDEMRGRRPALFKKDGPTAAQVRAWRQVRKTYGVETQKKRGASR